MLSPVGSSPRVRGKLARIGVRCSCFRIIPARAGQTTMSSCTGSRMPDHPRACGANFYQALGIKNLPGSSPRVRGKRLLVNRHCIGHRIIPARAGQTARSNPNRGSPSDHPRACGANAGYRRIWLATGGSSPRVRGKLRGADAVDHALRIIPARAGQTDW